jgi:hypothetical protein
MLKKKHRFESASMKEITDIILKPTAH